MIYSKLSSTVNKKVYPFWANKHQFTGIFERFLPAKLQFVCCFYIAESHTLPLKRIIDFSVTIPGSIPTVDG